MAFLKQSTAYTRMFLLVQSADHVSGLTGASPTVTLSKAGAAFGAAAGAVSEVASGWYKVALTSADTNTLGDLAIHVTATNGDPSDLVDQVLAVDLADATALGLSRLDAAVSSRAAIADYTTARAAKLDNLDATVSSRSSHTAADVWAAATRTLSAFAFSVTVGTNNDKTGYSLSAAGIQAIWDALTSALTTAGSVGKRIADNLDAAVSTRSSHTAADVWAVGTRTLTAFSFAVDFSAAAVTAIWDKATSALTTAGSIGKRLADDVDAAISSRLAAGSYTAPDNTSVTAIKAKTDNLPAAPAAVGDIPTASAIAAAVWTAGTRTLTSFGTLAADVWAVATRTLTTSSGPTALQISTQVWSEALPGSFASGSAGQKLNAAGASADPLLNVVPGSYPSGTAGNVLGSIGPGRITVVSPAVSQDGGTVTIVRGDDYAAADGRALDWTDAGGVWPDLTGASVTFTARFGSVVLSKAVTIVTSSGANKKVRVELTSAETTPLPIGTRGFDIQATLADTHVVTLLRGTITVVEDQTHA